MFGGTAPTWMLSVGQANVPFGYHKAAMKGLGCRPFNTMLAAKGLQQHLWADGHVPHSPLPTIRFPTAPRTNNAIN